MVAVSFIVALYLRLASVKLAEFVGKIRMLVNYVKLLIVVDDCANIFVVRGWVVEVSIVFFFRFFILGYFSQFLHQYISHLV